MILQSYAFQKYALILYVTKYDVIIILNLENYFNCSVLILSICTLLAFAKKILKTGELEIRFLSVLYTNISCKVDLSQCAVSMATESTFSGQQLNF